MNYFKILGIIFGFATLLKPVYMHLLPFDEMKFIKKAYGEKRPWWIVLVSLIGVFLVGLTWYNHFTLDVKYSIVITLIFSLFAIKIFFLLFSYKNFQQWVANLVKKDKGKKVILIDIYVGIIGLIILILTFILY
jgi:hypothetical protein